MALLALAAPAAAEAQPGPAKPVSSGVTGDIRCLLTMVVLGQNKERQQAAQLGVYFFSGRISARAPTIDLSKAMHAEALTLNSGPALEAESRRCGPMITGSLQAVQKGLNSLHPAGPAPATGPAPAPAPAPLPPSALPH